MRKESRQQQARLLWDIVCQPPFLSQGVGCYVVVPIVSDGFSFQPPDGYQIYGFKGGPCLRVGLSFQG